MQFVTSSGPGKGIAEWSRGEKNDPFFFGRGPGKGVTESEFFIRKTSSRLYLFVWCRDGVSIRHLATYEALLSAPTTGPFATGRGC